MTARAKFLNEISDEVLSISRINEGHGLEIVDIIERRHVQIKTRGPINPKQCSVANFEYPVRLAISIETESIHLPHHVGMIVRNSDGLMIAEVTKGNPRSFPKDGYNLDPGGPIKTYIQFNAAFDIQVTSEGIRLSLDTQTNVQIGIRSHHKQPADTIKTTCEIGDLMESVSYFSSALKTTSCERSYPTLRGHPPTLEISHELSIPSTLAKPDTGISLEVPRSYKAVYTCSSLAYYLGAKIYSGNEPRLITESGFEKPLETDEVPFEEMVERTLKQVFFLDCITRTEGSFQVDLHERRQIETKIDLDFSELYGEPTAIQIESYLGIQFDAIKPHFPKWKLTSHVLPDPSTIEALPFLVNDLSVIKEAKDDSMTESARAACKTQGVAGTPKANSIELSQLNIPTIQIEEEDSMEQNWIGPGAPLGASKAILQAYKNRLDRPPSNQSIEIIVVCNASEMGQERDKLEDVYGSRSELPFDVSVHRHLTVSEMGAVLESESDFLHYIGHIDSGGFECSNGKLDLKSLDHVGASVFLLNACSSYQQGIQMINLGSVAGVVTLEDVINSGAERIGLSLARLLNSGFPLRPAMNIARNESVMGGSYLVLGDGSVDIAQTEIGVQGVCGLRNEGSDWLLNFTSFPTRDTGLGSIYTLHLGRCEEFYLISGDTEKYSLDKDELLEFLAIEEMPVQYKGELTWSGDLSRRLS